MGATYHPPADRALAAEWLGKLQAVEAVPPLITLCEDPDGGVRSSTVVALGQIGDERAVEPLARLAADRNQESVEGATTFSSNEKAFWHYGRELPARMRYNVRHAAKHALCLVSPIYLDPSPIDLAEAIIELRWELAADPAGLAKFGRDGWGAHADLAYRNTVAYLKADRRYFRCYTAIRTIAAARSMRGGNPALAAVFGCDVENLELDAARRLAESNRRAEVQALLREVLARPNLSPLTLTACLQVVCEQEPSAAHALALRLLNKMGTADGNAWERFPHITSRVLRRALTAEDLPAVTALRDAQSEPARRDALTELARLLAGGPPAPDDLFDLADATRLPVEQRQPAIDLFLRELNKPELDWKTFRAAYHLGRLKERAAVPGLLRLLDGPDSGSYGVLHGIADWYPTMAAWALTQIADPACVPILREKALHQARDLEKDGLFSGALQAYGRLAGEQAVEDLVGILNQKPGSRFASIGWNMRVSSSRQLFFGKIQPREQEAFPRLGSSQETAANALSLIGGDRARDALVGYLTSENGKAHLTEVIVEAIFRVAPEQLDVWSKETLESTEPWGFNSLRETAVAVRLRFFPQQSVELARSILEDTTHPLHWSVVGLLRADNFQDGGVTKALIHLLEQPAPVPDQKRPSGFDLRLEVIDAIGCQGGPQAMAALLQIAGGTAAKPSVSP